VLPSWLTAKPVLLKPIRKANKLCQASPAERGFAKQQLEISKEKDKKPFQEMTV
jgi:hypothetical protein